MTNAITPLIREFVCVVGIVFVALIGCSPAIEAGPKHDTVLATSTPTSKHLSTQSPNMVATVTDTQNSSPDLPSITSYFDMKVDARSDLNRDSILQWINNAYGIDPIERSDENEQHRRLSWRRDGFDHSVYMLNQSFILYQIQRVKYRYTLDSIVDELGVPEYVFFGLYPYYEESMTCEIGLEYPTQGVNIYFSVYGDSATMSAPNDEYGILLDPDLSFHPDIVFTSKYSDVEDYISDIPIFDSWLPEERLMRYVEWPGIGEWLLAPVVNDLGE